MPKAVFVAPPLNTAEIPAEGAQVTIKEIRVVTDQWTSIGTVSKGLGLNVELGGKMYSQLFSIDKEILTGSIGRILVSAGINDTDAKDFQTKLKTLIGKKLKVIKKGGKIYWYPLES